MQQSQVAAGQFRPNLIWGFWKEKSLRKSHKFVQTGFQAITPDLPDFLMPHPDSKAQLDTLRQQQITLARKIKEAEAEARKKEREKDERRKLLAGAAALAELAAHPDSPFAVTFVGLLNHGLTKAPDRALFRLPPLPKEAKAEAAPDGLAPDEPATSPPAAAPVPQPREPTETAAEHFERLLGRLNALDRPVSESSSSS